MTLIDLSKKNHISFTYTCYKCGVQETSEVENTSATKDILSASKVPINWGIYWDKETVKHSSGIKIYYTNMRYLCPECFEKYKIIQIFK